MINAKKAARHFIVQITDDGLAWRRDEDKIATEAALDGIYVIRTSLPRTRSAPAPRWSPARRWRTSSGCSAA